MKGLQKLERIKKLSCVWDAENDEFKDAVEIVPNAFKTVEKELKALRAIVKTLNIKVSVNKLGQCFLEDNHCIYAISQSTYDLLKEALL